MLCKDIKKCLVNIYISCVILKRTEAICIAENMVSFWNLLLCYCVFLLLTSLYPKIWDVGYNNNDKSLTMVD